MKINIQRTNDDYLMQATGSSGNTVYIDHSGMEVVQGVSPMELVLMAIGSCSSIDIIAILKKQRQEIVSYNVTVTGERFEKDHAKPFKNAHVHVFLTGKIDAEKAKHAASLSFEKYCSVTKSFDSSLPVTYSVTVNDVVVEGNF